MGTIVANVKLAALLAFGVFSALQMIVHSMLRTKQWVSTPETVACLFGMLVSLAVFFIAYFLESGQSPSTPRRSLTAHRSRPREDRSHLSKGVDVRERKD